MKEPSIVIFFDLIVRFVTALSLKAPPSSSFVVDGIFTSINSEFPAKAPSAIFSTPSGNDIFAKTPPPIAPCSICFNDFGIFN